MLPSVEILLSDAWNVVDKAVDPPGAIFLPAAFDVFRSGDTHKLTFQIPPDHPGFRHGWAGITVKDVKIEIPGVRTSDDKVSIELVHSGNAIFAKSRDDQGRLTLVTYTHRPQRSVISFDLNKVSPAYNLGGGEGWGISARLPFGHSLFCLSIM